MHKPAALLALMLSSLFALSTFTLPAAADQFATCHLSIAVTSTPKTNKKDKFFVMTGKSFYVKILVKKTNLQFGAPDVSLRITLPPKICVQKTKSLIGPATAVVNDGNIYWVDFTFDKKGKRQFGLKARVELDYTNMTVPVQVTAYSVSNNCTTTATTLNIPVVQGGKISHARRRNTGGVCILPPPPPANTTDPFIASGIGQRCKEAELTDLRRLRRELSVANGTYPTTEECFAHCDEIEGFEPPFYFNLETLPGGNNCYWYVVYFIQEPLFPLEIASFSLHSCPLLNQAALMCG